MESGKPDHRRRPHHDRRRRSAGRHGDERIPDDGGSVSPWLVRSPRKLPEAVAALGNEGLCRRRDPGHQPRRRTGLSRWPTFWPTGVRSSSSPAMAPRARRAFCRLRVLQKPIDGRRWRVFWCAPTLSPWRLRQTRAPPCASTWSVHRPSRLRRSRASTWPARDNAWRAALPCRFSLTGAVASGWPSTNCQCSWLRKADVVCSGSPAPPEHIKRTS